LTSFCRIHPAWGGAWDGTRRPHSLPSPCGIFPGLSSFHHFERDPFGPITDTLCQDTKPNL
jgi:hypothetical protein